MSANGKAYRTPEERIADIPAILEAINEGIREALLDHKRNGNPICTWRDGQVVWIQPEDIPVEDPLHPAGSKS